VHDKKRLKTELMMKLQWILLCLSILAAVGCASSPRTATGADDKFLLARLDDQAKSKALTDQGIEEYQIQLVRKEDFSKVESIREFFAVALRFDPENIMAKQYLSLVENFKSARLKKKVQEVKTYLAKPKRKEDEDYAMCLAVLAAARLDPADATVAKLLRDTSQVRVNLVNSYLGKAKASVAKINGSTPQPTRDSLSVDAFQNASKAVTIDPENSAAKNQVAQLREELSKIATRRIENANKLIAAGKFEEARIESLYVYELSKKAGGAFADDIRALNYSLNYKWAKSLYAKKDYTQAEAKVNTALSVRKTDEALGLKKSITDMTAALKKRIADEADAQQKKASEKAAEAEQETYFTSSLQELDEFISQGDLISAWNKIDATSQIATDQKKLDELEERKGKIDSMLKGAYDKAIAAYREEDFKSAIEYLQTIVQINVDYEQAADYLEKAKS
jgi:hypothetical protein